MKAILDRLPGPWRAESRAGTVSRSQPSERPFAADSQSKGWLEAASTYLGRVTSSAEFRNSQSSAEGGAVPEASLIKPVALQPQVFSFLLERPSQCGCTLFYSFLLRSLLQTSDDMIACQGALASISSKTKPNYLRYCKMRCTFKQEF